MFDAGSRTAFASVEARNERIEERIEESTKGARFQVKSTDARRVYVEQKKRLVMLIFINRMRQGGQSFVSACDGAEWTRIQAHCGIEKLVHLTGLLYNRKHHDPKQFWLRTLPMQIGSDADDDESRWRVLSAIINARLPFGSLGFLLIYCI